MPSGLIISILCLCPSYRRKIKLGCSFIGLADTTEHEELFDIIFGKAYHPVALWLRPNHTESDPHGVLESHLQGCIGQLPFLLSERRFDQAPATQHVTLLWDNPFRPFPGSDLKSKSALL
jgi:hypothetical protein